MENHIKMMAQKILGADFELFPEVNGRNMVEGKKVRIDFLAYPKKHLIDNGFDNQVFGIEAKSVDYSQTKKINKLVWQAISYAQSEFEFNNSLIRPMFVVVCVFKEPEFGSPGFQEWKTLSRFAQYGNVGVIELEPFWRVRFGDCSYYNQRNGKSSIANLGTKRNVGSL